MGSRSGTSFTLVEFLVVVAILGVLVALALPCLMSAGGAMGFFEQPEAVFEAVVVRKYEVIDDTGDMASTVHRLEVRRLGSQYVEVLNNLNDPFNGKSGSDSLQANLAVGSVYRFRTLGANNEAWGLFPNVIEAQPVPR